MAFSATWATDGAVRAEASLLELCRVVTEEGDSQ